MSQLRKSVVLLGVLAFVAIALGLFAYFGVVRGDEEKDAQEKVEAKFLSGAGSTSDGGAAGVEYVRIVVGTAEGATTLERQGKTWRMVAPVNAAVDALVVDALKSQLDGLELTRVMEQMPTPEDFKRYGLEPPLFSIEVTARPLGGGAEKTWRLKGGGENPFDGSFFLQREGDPKIYTAPGGVRFNLFRTTVDLRNKKVLEVPAKEISGVEVKTPSRELALAKTGKVWRMSKPEVSGADPQAVQAIFGALANERALSFRVDSSEERTKAGLDAPVASVVFALEKGEPIRFDFGRPSAAADAGGSLFVLRSQGHETELAEVSPSVLSVFEKDPAALRDRSVISFEKERVARIEFLRGPSKIVVERELTDGGSLENWRVVEPGRGPAKKFKMTSVLWTLGSLKAKELRDENPKSWAKWGLEKPVQEVRLFDASGAVIAALLIGRPVQDREGFVFARGTRNQIVEMSSERLVDLPASIEDVIDLGRASTPTADAGP